MIYINFEGGAVADRRNDDDTLPVGLSQTVDKRLDRLGEGLRRIYSTQRDLPDQLADALSEMEGIEGTDSGTGSSSCD
ncbi:hypothetical protein [Glacieibacterium frigidum]|uniref:Uncharacterized protein n=1 Tax=Glacieibacterium frigidum TaxID=2593303 RepID=A0A552U977_9SPHN|nr:hypothetical protein [Glacieibacterium frigidum]TRW14776.1 hypothetical protein FMM06_13935 [Glacieibacterium frigidum]